MNGLCPHLRRYFNNNCLFLITVITLAPVLMHNLKRAAECNINDFNQNIIITLSQN